MVNNKQSIESIDSYPMSKSMVHCALCIVGKPDHSLAVVISNRWGFLFTEQTSSFEFVWLSYTNICFSVQIKLVMLDEGCLLF